MRRTRKFWGEKDWTTETWTKRLCKIEGAFDLEIRGNQPSTFDVSLATDRNRMPEASTREEIGFPNELELFAKGTETRVTGLKGPWLADTTKGREMMAAIKTVMKRRPKMLKRFFIRLSLNKLKAGSSKEPS